MCIIRAQSLERYNTQMRKDSREGSTTLPKFVPGIKRGRSATFSLFLFFRSGSIRICAERRGKNHPPRSRTCTLIHLEKEFYEILGYSTPIHWRRNTAHQYFPVVKAYSRDALHPKVSLRVSLLTIELRAARVPYIFVPFRYMPSERCAAVHISRSP